MCLESYLLRNVLKLIPEHYLASTLMAISFSHFYKLLSKPDLTPFPKLASTKVDISHTISMPIVEPNTLQSLRPFCRISREIYIYVFNHQWQTDAGGFESLLCHFPDFQS